MAITAIDGSDSAEAWVLNMRTCALAHRAGSGTEVCRLVVPLSNAMVISNYTMENSMVSFDFTMVNTMVRNGAIETALCRFLRPAVLTWQRRGS